MQIDKNGFYDLIAKRKAAISYPIGIKRPSLCSLCLFTEDSCSEHKE